MDRNDLARKEQENNALVRQVARRAAELQGMRPEYWEGMPADVRESFERGALYVLSALKALGWTLVPPGQLTPWDP